MIDVRAMFESYNREALKVLSRSGVAEILFSLARSPKRFSQLMFETRLNPGILDRHLKALTKLGLVEKFDGVYDLTPKGRDVANVLSQLLGMF